LGSDLESFGPVLCSNKIIVNDIKLPDSGQRLVQEWDIMVQYEEVHTAAKHLRNIFSTK
jgi:hypothetical protein